MRWLTSWLTRKQDEAAERRVTRCLNERQLLDIMEASGTYSKAAIEKQRRRVQLACTKVDG